MNSSTQNINLPVQLVQYFIMERKASQLRVFLYLKNTFRDGHFIVDRKFRVKACKALGFKADKTFNTHLKWLLKKGFLTLNAKTGNYRIKSWVRIAKMLKFAAYSSVLINITDYTKKLMSLFSGILYMYWSKIKQLWQNLQEKNVKRQSQSKAYRTNAPEPLHLPLSYMSNILKMSKSYASKLKNLAVKHKFIFVQHCFELTSLTFEEKKHAQQFNEKIVVEDRKIQIQLPDKLTFSKELHLTRNFGIYKFLKNEKILSDSLPGCRNVQINNR